MSRTIFQPRRKLTRIEGHGTGVSISAFSVFSLYVFDGALEEPILFKHNLLELRLLF